MPTKKTSVITETAQVLSLCMEKQSVIAQKKKWENKNNDLKYLKNEIVYYKNHLKSHIKWLRATYIKKASQFTHLILLNNAGKIFVVDDSRYISIQAKCFY